MQGPNNSKKNISRQETTPLPDNLDSIIKKIIDDQQIPAVILSTGSFCPVHLGHIDQIIQAQQFLEENTKFKVICSYLSPSNDQYVLHKSQQNKFSEYFIDFNKRCELINLTLKNKELTKNKIFIDKWEGSHLQFIDFPTVACSLDQYFKEINNKIEIFLCQGSDMLKTGFDSGHKNLFFEKKSVYINYILIERNSDDGNYVKQQNEKYKSFSLNQMKNEGLYYVKSNDNQVSSTQIRSFIKNGAKQNELDQIKQFIDLDVLSELQTLFQKQQNDQNNYKK